MMSSGKVGYVTPRLYPEDATKYFGMTETYDISKLESILPTLLDSSKSLYTYTSADAALHKRITSALQTVDGVTVSYDWGKLPNS